MHIPYFLYTWSITIAVTSFFWIISSVMLQQSAGVEVLQLAAQSELFGAEGMQPGQAQALLLTAEENLPEGPATQALSHQKWCSSDRRKAMQTKCRYLPEGKKKDIKLLLWTDCFSPWRRWANARWLHCNLREEQCGWQDKLLPGSSSFFLGCQGCLIAFSRHLVFRQLNVTEVNPAFMPRCGTHCFGELWHVWCQDRYGSLEMKLGHSPVIKGIATPQIWMLLLSDPSCEPWKNHRRQDF